MSTKPFKIFLESYVSKEDELNVAKKAHLRSGDHGDTHVEVKVHAGYRSLQRGHDMKKEHWDDIIRNTLTKVKERGAGHYLTYSNKHKQGIVSEYMPDKKRLEITTVLPKGKSFAKEGTQRYVVECLLNDIVYIIIE